jgi:hypothetical protein
VKNVPNDQELYRRVIAEAKKKFDVYPSAYANGWVVQEYKRRGGTYRVEKANSFASRSEAGRYAASIRWQNARGEGGDIQEGQGNGAHVLATFVRPNKATRKEIVAEIDSQYADGRISANTNPDWLDGLKNIVRYDQSLVITRSDSDKSITGVAGFEVGRPGEEMILTSLFSVGGRSRGAGSTMMAEVARVGVERRQSGLLVHNATGGARPFYYKMGGRPSNDSVSIRQKVGPDMTASAKDVPVSEFLNPSSNISWKPVWDKKAMAELANRVEKAKSFGSSSEAGRYAAGIRWQNARGGAGAGGNSGATTGVSIGGSEYQIGLENPLVDNVSGATQYAITSPKGKTGMLQVFPDGMPRVIGLPSMRLSTVKLIEALRGKVPGIVE